MENAPAIAKALISESFTEEASWEDWKVALCKILSTEAGRSGVPLAYVIRDNNVSSPNTRQYFFDEYINKEVLDGT